MSKRYALVIGNNEYKDKNLTKLTAPLKDVNDFVELLQDPGIGGFDEVQKIENSEVSIVQRTIASFFSKKKRDDLLLLYFSGHSLLNDRGQLYLALKDTEIDLLSGTGIPTSFLTQEMDLSRSQRQVVILDSCHSGAFPKGTKASTGKRVGVGTTLKGNGYGRIILTASDSTQYAWEGKEFTGEPENSLFTHFMIEGLKTGKADLNQDGRIDLNELYDYVYEKVIKHTPKQTPGKWSFKEDGTIYIAQNPNIKKLSMHRLPTELLQAVESPIAAVRKAIIGELGLLLEQKDADLKQGAINALNHLKEDANSEIARMASDLLDSVNPKVKQENTEEVATSEKTKSKEPKPNDEEKNEKEIWVILKRANAALTANNYDKASKDFKEILKIDPYQEEAKKGLKAVEERRNSILINGLLEKAREESDSRQYNDAILTYQMALKLGAKEKDIENLINSTKQKIKDAEKNQQLFEEVEARIEEGKLTDAKKLLDEIQKIDPEYPKLKMLLAKVEERLQIEAEIERKLAEGKKFFDENKLQDASLSFKSVLEIAPENEFARDHLEIIDKKTNANKAQVLVEKGMGLSQNNQFDAAIQTLESALELDPENEEIKNHLTQVKARLEGKKKEESLFKKGLALFKEKQLEEALTNFNLIVKENPANVDANEYITRIQKRLLEIDLAKQLNVEAESYVSRKRYDLALKTYNRILEMDPENEEAKAGKAKVSGLLNKSGSKTVGSSLKAQQTSKLSLTRKILLGILFIALASLAYFIFVPGGPNTNDDRFDLSNAASTAQEEMLKAKQQALTLGLDSLETELFSKGENAEARGDKEFEQGNNMSARLSFNSARDFYKNAIQKNSGEYQALNQEDAKLKEPVLILKKDMEEIKTKLESLDASVDSETYKQALEAEQEAIKAFNESDYNAAISSYQSAANLFRKATQETESKNLKAEENLNNIKRIVNGSKDGMLEEKDKAIKAKAQEFATDLFVKAEKKEKEGINFMKKESKRSFLLAQNAFQEAADIYVESTTEAINQAGIKKATDEALAAKASMTKAKNSVPGSSTEKQAEATYSSASKTEKMAEEFLSEKNYQASKRSFQQAEQLYKQAKPLVEAQIAAAAKKAEEDKKKEAARLEAERKKAEAQNEIRKMIAAYKASLESGEISRFKAYVSPDVEKNWANFFKRVKDIEVSTQDEIISVNDLEAEANFKVTLSYFNQDNKKTEKRNLNQKWKLKFVNGNWVRSSN